MKHGFIVRSLVALLFITCLVASIDSTTPSSATAQSVKNEGMQSDTFYIGQHYGGGIIFWIDDSGQHGLIAAESDQGFTRWSDRHYPLTGATGTAVGTGRENTRKIIAVQGRRYTYAARLCAAYRGGDYSDWFLPSKDELYLLYQQKSVVGGFIGGAYWSSSEFDYSLAWTKFFYNDSAVYSHKDRFDYVRAIRKF